MPCRPEHSGDHISKREMQGGDHAWLHSHAGACGSGLPLRFLTYEVVDQLTKNGVGQSTCLGLGGDPVVGLSFIDVLKMFRDDPETRRWA